MSRLDDTLGVLVVSIGSIESRCERPHRRGGRGEASGGHQWAGVTTAFATGPEPSLTEATTELRRRGASRWSSHRGFWRQDDCRIGCDIRCGAGIEMAAPFGAHRLVAETVLDRFVRR